MNKFASACLARVCALAACAAAARGAFCSPSVWRSALLAGNGSNGRLDGPGATAQLSGPYGLALDEAARVLYVASKATFCSVRNISLATGIVRTMAGNGSCAADVDGVGLAASFIGPGQLALDASAGLLYIASTTAPGCTIRRLAIASRAVTTVAGVSGACGYVDGVGTGARFGGPRGVAVHPAAGLLYVVDATYNNLRLIQLASGVVTTLAGGGGAPTPALSTARLRRRCFRRQWQSSTTPLLARCGWPTKATTSSGALPSSHRASSAP